MKEEKKKPKTTRTLLWLVAKCNHTEKERTDNEKEEVVVEMKRKQQTLRANKHLTGL